MSIQLSKRILVVVALAATMALAACDPNNPASTTSPTATATGTLQGRVTVGGVALAGVTVTLNGATTTTNATGAYSFSNVNVGVSTVTISGYPADVTFPATGQSFEVTFAGAVAMVNFDGTRSAGFQGGRLTVSGGNASHDPFVFAAGSGGVLVGLKATTAPNGVATVSGNAFAPSGFPTLTGTFYGDSLNVAGSGTIAGVPNVSVTAIGTVSGDHWVLEIVVGGDGKLPGGQAIRYMFTAN